MLRTLARHWPEYLIEGALLGCFMLSASFFGVLLEHPASPVRAAIPDEFLRRTLMGLAMGLTALALVYSRFGLRSGAHINPSVTLTFLRLGKVCGTDALCYAIAQFAGAALGMLVASLLLSRWIADPHVHYVATLPGARGLMVAFVAEVAISFALMGVVLVAASHPRLAPHTGFFAAACVWAWITFEAPLSGMSMNPARSFGSALAALDGRGLWIYFIAPPLGMLAAAELSRFIPRWRAVACAKLVHDLRYRCIFCGHHPS